MMTFDPDGIVRIVFHPSAGRGAGQQRAENLASSLHAINVESEIVDASVVSMETTGTNTVACRGFVVVGGDGLIHRVLPRFVSTGIPVGIVPAGSGNDLWRMLAHQNQQESIERIVSHFMHRREAMKVDVLELKFENDPGHIRLALGAVSWGAEAQINAAANELPRQLGAFRYVVGLIFALPRLKSFHSSVIAPEFSFDGPALAASIANIRSLGGGIRLFPSADFTDGVLELSMVRGKNVLPVLPSIGKILRGAAHRWKISNRLSSAHVETQQDSFADGEYVGTGNFDVRVLTGAIELIS
ncbi:diacylglycerol kinase family protein [Glutamicibacter sp. JL.03c]|uniref:diacylglycerol/lipid kinase family protein n=1 Tax=Glutamicibacter sp. JL.03c TaxID=2984842 RepID=UPI0021F7525C|nr:diacylglycerol kinase family protein [Glutamicibacter sp. JL.03c]UYQ76409.1 diacylglycerol kinase family protein [Glutamicibacter sp. JL.03c]